jgi:putative FmdB family regulatory protein
MPVYDYHCKKCGHDFIVIETLGEHEEHLEVLPKCPECKSEDTERVITGVHVQTGKKF